MQGSKKQHPENLQNCLGFIHNFGKGNIRRPFLTSLVCMSNLILSQQQHVAHEVQAEQAWPKMWRRNKKGFFKKCQKFVSFYGKIILNIWKSTVNFNWYWVSEPFKAQHAFRHSIAINHVQRAHIFEMIPRINRIYLSEQFQVTCILNDNT